MNVSSFVFRLGSRWFSCSTSLVKEVVGQKPVIQIPHKTNAILRGVVNINGELQLCVSLHQLLGIKQLMWNQYNRIVVIAKKGEIWAFAAEEIQGTLACDYNQIHPFSFESSHSISNYLLGTILFEEKEVNVLDEELLLSSLRRSLTV